MAAKSGISKIVWWMAGDAMHVCVLLLLLLTSAMMGLPVCVQLFCAGCPRAENKPPRTVTIKETSEDEPWINASHVFSCCATFVTTCVLKISNKTSSAGSEGTYVKTAGVKIHLGGADLNSRYDIFLYFNLKEKLLLGFIAACYFTFHQVTESSLKKERSYWCCRWLV